MLINYKTLILSLVLFVISSSNLNSQTLTDSTKQTQQFSIVELRLLSNYLIELENRRAEASLNNNEISLYKSTVEKFQKNETDYKNMITNQNNMIAMYKENEPSKWNKFIYGVPVGVLITIGIVCLIK